MNGWMYPLRACWLVALVAGCGGDGDLGPLPDLAMSADLAPGATQDSASVVDLASPLDVTAPVDFTAPVDLTAATDVSVPDDLAVGPDAPVADQAMPLDLAALDLQGAGDLAAVDSSSPGDLAGADLRTLPDLVAPADLVGLGAFTWKLVGNLAGFPRDSSGVDYVNNAIRSPQDNTSWNPMTGQPANTNLQMGGNFSRRGFACDCLINNHEYIMAGGGDGVGGAFIEPSYCDVDFNKNTLTTPNSPLAIHSPACAAANNLCYIIGGSVAPNGPYGTAATRVFNPQGGAFAAGPALPLPVVQSGAAVGGGKMLVAGGYCNGGGACPPKNDPSGMDATVLDVVYAADVINPAWQAQPKLPRAITGGRMVYLNNRFYLVGGSASAFGNMNLNGVMSFALGENGWRTDAAAPGMGPVVAVMTDGAAVLAVVYQNFAFDLYRGTP